MYNDSGNPLLAECSFLENTAYQTGGGMYSRSGRPVLSDCLFSKNTSNDGGGMHNFDSAVPVLTDCVFSENKAATSGGGMGNVKNSAPEMTGCSFVNNRADDLSQGGGAIASTESAPKITECSYSGNSARVKGGALYSYSCQGTFFHHQMPIPGCDKNPAGPEDVSFSSFFYFKGTNPVKAFGKLFRKSRGHMLYHHNRSGKVGIK